MSYMLGMEGFSNSAFLLQFLAMVFQVLELPM